jgi:hypothetical protein
MLASASTFCASSDFSSLELVATMVVVTAAIAISDPAKIRSLFFIAMKF